MHARCCLASDQHRELSTRSQADGLVPAAVLATNGLRVLCALGLRLDFGLLACQGFPFLDAVLVWTLFVRASPKILIFHVLAQHVLL